MRVLVRIVTIQLAALLLPEGWQHARELPPLPEALSDVVIHDAQVHVLLPPREHLVRVRVRVRVGVRVSLYLPYISPIAPL